MVTVFPDTLAMFELELAYENAPVLVDDGCGMVILAPLTKNVCTGLKLVVGIHLVIVNVAVTLSDV